MISYEEYRAIVVKRFRYYWEDLSDEEVEAYFEREGNEITKDRYEEDVEKLKEGRITERILENGCPASVSYCLSLMY
ncbi:MAG: hypothetical protein E6Y23_02315 [Negativicoccus massiliensis]|uniref:hypothetical protein n=1 Tax=Negativicoccus succinicivorans TaxID=620903 RepID=UPI0026F277D0|nr:hypothetical protein [Negativicoccus succinicivorans]MBS5887379.1 hypothetical protein [Negativicoccus succinicivorans]MDU4641561.1 hypothetical protein [Negativicoccus massiliensis]MDU5027343.1 hypothetical protein [Negativicoccus succinicivorans]